MPRIQTTSEWALVLRELAGREETPASDAGFRDELGNRALVAAPLIRWLGRGRGVAPVAGPPPTGAGVDVRLWCCAADPGASSEKVDVILSECFVETRDELDAGSLVPRQMHETIEVWTETELSAVHALSRLSGVHARPDWMNAARRCARWHVENVQPDNATNRPWAIHLFVKLALDENLNEALSYAETLLHNCRVTLGRPDRLSALILLDASEALGEEDPRAGRG